jgi:hypothetical protein
MVDGLFGCTFCVDKPTLLSWDGWMHPKVANLPNLSPVVYVSPIATLTVTHPPPLVATFIPDLPPVVDVQAHCSTSGFTDPVNFLVAHGGEVARKP